MTEVVIVFCGEPGSDKYAIDGKEVDLDNNIASTVVEVSSALKGAGLKVATLPLCNAGPGSMDGFISGLKEAASAGAVVFNLCEGAFGKSSLEMNVAALLELYGLSFTGNAPLALGISLNKALAKDILSAKGVPTPGFKVVENPSDPSVDGLRFPLIVKPLMEDASIGITSGAVVRSRDELAARAAYVISTYSQPALAEEYVDGREFNIAVIGNGAGARALPVSEITFVDFPPDKPRICCYEAKWVIDSPLYKKTVPVCPAEIPEALAAELSRVALKAYEAMGCRDYARVDARLSEAGEIKVLEVNPNPDISSGAGLARAAVAAGLGYAGLLKAIVGFARQRASFSAARGRLANALS